MNGKSRIIETGNWHLKVPTAIDKETNQIGVNASIAAFPQKRKQIRTFHLIRHNNPKSEESYFSPVFFVTAPQPIKYYGSVSRMFIDLFMGRNEKMGVK